ncbi:NACHT domain-containing protein [Kitasatospora sp. NPDC051853]|uniref:NACHT domain-containing protein n=1 Tax=Kitasatospora sp. NPDC051853 TaxID=3364058 RepID=UPI00379876DE
MDQARQRFAELLEEVRRAAGGPSVERLAKATPEGRGLSKSAVHRLLRGEFQRPPDRDAVTALLEACRSCAPGSRPVPPSLLDPSLWQRRHQELETLWGAAPPSKDTPPPEAAPALEAYARRVRETYGRLDLEVLTPDRDQDEQPVVELREVFVPQSVRADPPPVELPRELMQRLLEGGELTEDQLLPPGVERDWLAELQQAYRHRPAEPVLDVLAREDARRTVLLGDPGAGKSTIAHYLALVLTTDDPAAAVPALAPLAGHVPLVIELRSYAQQDWIGETFEDFLGHLEATEGMAPPAPVLRQLLADGRALVVFDGLDELFDPEVRARTSRRIAAFAARYPGCRYLVTSRVIGYQRAVLDGAGFAHHMLQDLDERQTAEFSRRWYATACPGNPAEAQRLVTRLGEALARSRPVRELAGNPLLLTILAILGRRQTLPRDRNSVYRHAVTVLVARWDRDVKHLTAHLPPAVADALDVLGQDERLEVLRLLARRMQEGEDGISGNHVHEAAVEQLFREYLVLCDVAPDRARQAARAMVGQLRERNFILARYGGGVYGFVHRTFLEYLAAADLIHRYEHEREWTPQQLVEEVLAPRAEDPAWHEVLLLIAGQLRERDVAALVDHLLRLFRQRETVTSADSLVLAVRVLAEVKKIGSLAGQSREVVDDLTAHLALEVDDYFSSPGRYELAVELAADLAGFSPNWVGRDRLLGWYGVWGQGMRAAATLACAVQDGPAAVLGFARTSWGQEDRLAAVAALPRWADEPGVVDALVGWAVHDPEPQMRSAALKALSAAAFEGAVDLDGLLRGRATRDPAPGPRSVAIQLLGRDPSDDGARRLLVERATEDAFQAVRAEAERVLSSTWGIHLGNGRARPAEPPWRRGSPGTAGVESESASAEDPMAEAMREWHAGRPVPLTNFMEEWGHGAPSWRSRGSSALTSVLLERFTQHPEDWEVIVGDVDADGVDVRATVLDILGRCAELANPALLALLLERFENEPDDELRQSVIGLLTLVPPGDPRLVEVLLDQAEHAWEPDLRRAVLTWLIRRRPAGVDLVPRLMDVAVADPVGELRLFARRALGQWWPDDVRCAAFFRGLPQEDDEQARWVRFQGIAATGGSAEELAGLLEEEPGDELRARMRSVIAFQGPPVPVARTALLSRLAADLRLAAGLRQAAAR